MGFSFENYCKAIRLSVKGRSSRSEYWSFFGFSWIYFIILFILTLFAEEYLPRVFLKALTLIIIVFLIFTFVINFCVMVRRLHDTGKTGWIAGGYYILVFLSNLVGVNAATADFFSALIFILWIVLLFLLCKKSNPFNNKYGESPLQERQSTDFKEINDGKSEKL